MQIILLSVQSCLPATYWEGRGHTSNVLQADEDDEDEPVYPAQPLNVPPSYETMMVIPYIAGFVVHKLSSLKCSTCFDRLFSSNTDKKFFLWCILMQGCTISIEMRDEGCLIKPPRAMIFICHQTEAVMKHMKEEDFCHRSLLIKIKLAVLNHSPMPVLSISDCENSVQTHDSLD